MKLTKEMVEIVKKEDGHKVAAINRYYCVNAVCVNCYEKTSRKIPKGKLAHDHLQRTKCENCGCAGYLAITQGEPVGSF